MINNEIKKGFIITFISKYSNVFFELGIGAVLARLLTPNEFGIVAVILVFTSFFNLLSDIGIGTAIIQNKKLEKKHVQSIFNYTILIGLITSIIFSFISYPIANFYNNDDYIKIGKYLSIAIFFFTLEIVPQAIIRKEKKFLKVEGTIVFANVITGIIAIYQAYHGYGYFSLINRAIFKSIMLFCINFYNSKLKISTSFNFQGMKMIMVYSSFQFAFNFINFFSRNLDNILIGKYLGAASLGFYDRAYRLMLYPVQNLTNVITPVLHPILSEYQNEPEVIYNSYKNILEILAFIGMPLSVFLYFSADEIIYLMYGSQWKESVPIFKILALTVWIQMTLSSTGAVFQALGKTNLLFYSGFISSVFMVTAILVGVLVFKDLEFIAYGLLIAFLLNFLQGFFFLFKMGFKKNALHFLKFFKIGFVSAVVLFLFFYFLVKIDFTAIIMLIYKGFLLFLSLVIGAFIMKKKYILFVCDKIKDKYF
ncbi:lipopolysaccharide biosynthesis protein [Flaviramulus sp. BrNp1-15]|uniref:lipopolysaccharide biosynthesis protein n=1 Tax=Flaviramulus sp. BrNp1-15 TaxID=2916754 RepID=UPI001EE95CBA|nr:lipopolysaccharide biosynthesis protein [Flaviramulus sp. BrNp1-15]ULC59750.1 lipopolysaccharide biosynthesis protein [Flaviramulus sp. BrNp1-15]